MAVLMADKMESVFDGKETIYEQAKSEGKEEKKMLHIVNDTPLKFETTVEKMLTTSTELAMMINEVFKPMMSDWYGSEIIIGNNGELIVNFTFKSITNGDNTRRVFLPINQATEKSSNQTLDRFMSVNLMNAAKSRNMEITSYGIEMMLDVMLPHVKQKIKADNVNTIRPFIGETYESAGMYSTVQNIYNTVTGIDINRVLNVVFGARESSNAGDHFIYKARALRPVDMAMMQYAYNKPSVNYIVEIERMTNNKYNNAMLKIGKTPMPGTITAITGTISDVRR